MAREQGSKIIAMLDLELVNAPDFNRITLLNIQKKKNHLILCSSAHYTDSNMYHTESKEGEIHSSPVQVYS